MKEKKKFAHGTKNTYNIDKGNKLMRLKGGENFYESVRCSFDWMGCTLKLYFSFSMTGPVKVYFKMSLCLPSFLNRLFLVLTLVSSLSLFFSLFSLLFSLILLSSRSGFRSPSQVHKQDIIKQFHSTIYILPKTNFTLNFPLNCITDSLKLKREHDSVNLLVHLSSLPSH